MNDTSDPVLKILLRYAAGDDNIRAVLLEGSRAFGEVDAYSDYDVAYVARSLAPYLNGAVLPFLTENFGDIAIMQAPDNGDPHDCYTQLIQFASGIRIDLSFYSIAFFGPVPRESASLVLLDKDRRFVKAAPPSDADFWLRRPSAAEYRDHCNEFWWCTPYVAKAVLRGQLLHALALLNDCVRSEYTWMLAHLGGARNDWQQVNPGKHGVHIKRWLPIGDYPYVDTLLGSYPHANGSEIRAALDSLMQAYAPLAAEVANALGYAYDAAESQKTVRFIENRLGQ